MERKIPKHFLLVFLLGITAAFFFGCAGLGGTIVAHFAVREAWQPLGAWAMTLAYLVLSVVVMKLRQMLE